MQTIDKEKLSEFTQELSEFQIEAAKTASTEVYDRYTIGKLEDHIVDLYQLSIDASHNGLQVLCGHMRDNIRNHLITGTNISNDEYVLMVEWKSLVKAYAVSCDNEKIVSALVINLSKSGWAYPLESKESEDFTAVLLDKKKPPQKTSTTSSVDNSNEIDSDQSDFEAVMQESSTSLADVFESIRSEEDEVEIESDDSLEIPLESGLGSLFDDEQSLADCFTEEIEAADAITEDVAAELDKPVAESRDNSASVDAEISEEKIDDEVVENEFVADVFDKDIQVSEDEPDVVADAYESIEAASDTDIIIDKVEVSEDSSSVIEESIASNAEDAIFVTEDESEFDDSEYKESFDEDLKVAEEAINHSNTSETSSDTDIIIDKIEISEEKSVSIDEEETKDLGAELFVEDESSEDSHEASYESKFEKDLESVKQPSVWNISSASSKEETKDVEAELFVEDESGEDNHEASYESEFEKDLESVKQSSVWNISSASSKEETKDVEAELYVEDESGEDNHEASYESEFEKDLESVKQASVKDESKSVENASEVVSPEAVTELREEEKAKPVKEDITGDSISTKKDVKKSKSKNKKNEKKEKRSRSIIEAYVDVIASKQKKEPENVPQELEQELIEEPPEEKQELESVEDILSRYSEWDESQKELLSLIISEVIEVINQQEEVLSVLDAVPVNKNAVREMLALYIEQIERIGSAAEMVGLDALQKMCELIDFHFGDLDKSSVEGIIDSKDRIKRWPYVVYGYLKDIHNQDSHKEVLDYISDDEWVRTIREDIKSELMEAFSNSTISIEKNEHDQRIKEATAEHVDVSIPDDVQAELLDGMLQELPRQTEEFSSSIQELVKDKFLEQLEVTQRIAHTIKGAANTVGIVGVATLTHHLEDILQALLKAESKPSENLHVALIDASDCLEQMSEFLLGQGEQPSDAVSVLQTILDWANYIDEFGPPHDGIESDENKSLTKNDSLSDNDKTVELEEKEKSKAAQDSSLRVSANMIDNLINQSGENIIAVSQMQENIKQLLMGMRDIKVNKDSVYVLSQHLEHLIDVQGASSKFSSSQDDEKFDPLELDQYNELHTYSRRLIEATADSVELVKELEDRLLSLESVISDQSRAQKDSQYAMLKTRMMPIESIVPRLKRGVRQAAKISGKSVELSVEGADMLVDIKILNNLIDPLMHLLRNAVDHGIEDESERKASNKPLIGSIQLTFLQTGERLEISCKDDGKGLDAQKIRQRAIEKNLLLNEDQQLDDDEIYQIIMQHGFSTRNEVTQLSGRGVGMDVVYSSIKELNGSVVLSSEKNNGMTVELSLPLSLLSANALLVTTATGTMAVSTSGIEEIIQVNVKDLKDTAEGLMAFVDDSEYSAVHLEQLLEMRFSKKTGNEAAYSALVINELGDQKKLVLVKEIQSVRDIIIKPFSYYLPKVIGMVGATILGNGDIASVIDVTDLLPKYSSNLSTVNSEVGSDLEEIHQASVLVVEDSISTRRSLAEFMQDLNYKVYTAKDGVEAIEVMRDHRPSILLTDLEMPRMNGLELTSHIRSNDDTKDIPIIMITSRTTEKHKQEAKSIGVNEYLTKPYVEDILLEKVQHLSIAK